VLVLGEMRELGAQSGSEHARVGEAVGGCRAAALVAVAGDAAAFVEPARAGGVDACFAEDASAALPLVLERLQAGDVVLVKASRGVRAERVVEGLLAARGSAA
jgi:UDP-N-acetylmuramoyl-tripeptide--D-alanyl-D-alanine ligase